MRFSFDWESMKDPKKRLLLAVILLAAGLVWLLVPIRNDAVKKEDCIRVEATFQDCKYRTLDDAINANSIYLVFQDFTTDLDIHSSCADDAMTQALMEMKPGAKMRLLYDEGSRIVYELEVNGEVWFTFEEAWAKINGNMELGTMFARIITVAGGVLLVSAVPSLLLRLRKKEELQ